MECLSCILLSAFILSRFETLAANAPAEVNVSLSLPKTVTTANWVVSVERSSTTNEPTLNFDSTLETLQRHQPSTLRTIVAEDNAYNKTDERIKASHTSIASIDSIQTTDEDGLTDGFDVKSRLKGTAVGPLWIKTTMTTPSSINSGSIIPSSLKETTIQLTNFQFMPVTTVATTTMAMTEWDTRHSSKTAEWHKYLNSSLTSTVRSIFSNEFSTISEKSNGIYYGNHLTNDSQRVSDTVWPVKHASVVEGDVILGGLMMVHSREDNITCGPIMPQGGIQALEAMLFTLDRINAIGLLPNISLGAHILDDCDKDTYGLEMAVDFIKDCHAEFLYYCTIENIFLTGLVGPYNLLSAKLQNFDNDIGCSYVVNGGIGLALLFIVLTTLI